MYKIIASKYKLNEFLGVVLLALVIVCCAKDVINNIAYLLLPVRPISIQALSNEGNREVTIVYKEDDNEIFPILMEQSRKIESNWQYEEGEKGKNWTSLTLPPCSTKIMIYLKESPRVHMTAFGNRQGGVIGIDVNGETRVYDLYMDTDNTELIQIFPFKNSNRIVFIKLSLYVILFVLITGLGLVFEYFIKTRSLNGRMKEFLCMPISLFDFVIIWMGLFAFSLIIYKVIGIPNYLEIGDEAVYWNQPILNNGKWDAAYLAELYSVRGYWSYIIPSISQIIGDSFSIDSIIVYLLFPSAAISWFAVFILPGLYLKLNGNNVIKLMIVSVVLMFITTWRDLLTCVSTDLFGLVFLFASFFYMISFAQNRTWPLAMWAGITSSISCSYRTANFLAILLVVLYCIYIIVIDKGKAKETVIGGMIGVVSFIIICIPQFQVNLERNHIGFLPYDHENAWFGRSQTAFSSDLALTKGNISYPLYATDDQMLTMKQNCYDNEVPLSMSQLLDVYTDNPLETIMLIGKKLIIGFDKQTNISYPIPGPGVPWRTTKGMIFSLWNYFVLFCGLFALRNDEGITKNERALFVMIFFSLILPETFMKIEWRYIIAGYGILYYFFSFHFITDLVLLKDNRVDLLENKGFLLHFSIFLLIYYTASFIFLA